MHPEQSPQPRKRVLRLLLFVLVGLAALSALVPLLLPLLIGQLLVGLGLGSATLDAISIAPLQGRIELRELRGMQAGAVPLHLKSLRLDIDTAALLEKRLLFESVEIDGLDLSIQQYRNGVLRIGGIILPAKKETAQPTAAPPAVPWMAGIERLILTDSTVRYLSTGATVPLHFRRIELENLLPWQSQAVSQLALEGRLGDADVELSLNTQPFAKAFALDANLALAPLALDSLTTLGLVPYPVQGTLASSGTFKVRYSADGRLAVEHRGETRLKKVHITLGESVFRIGELSWDGRGSYRSDREIPTAEGQLTLTQLAIIEDEQAPPLLINSRLHIDKLQLNEEPRLSAEQVSMDGLHVRLTLDKKGQLQLPALARRVDGNKKPPAGGEQQTLSQPLAVTLGTIGITNGRLDLADHSVSPTFKETLYLRNLQLQGIDSSRPDRASGFKLQGRLGEYAGLSLEGRLQLFVTPPNLAASGQLDGLDLPPLSPYLERLLGYRVESGHLDLQLTASLQDRLLEGNSTLKLNNLRVEAVDEKAREALETKLDVPLKTALALLRDNNNDINLEVPFSGDLNDPKFDVSDAVNTALSHSLKTAAVGYMRFALQPYGAIISAIKLAGEVANYVSLQPIRFVPGGLVPEEDPSPYLEKLATLLGERPQLRLRLCGVAVLADQQALLAQDKRKKAEVPAETLEEMARARAAWLKGLLVNDYRIEAERLFICQPRVEMKEEALPRLELLI